MSAIGVHFKLDVSTSAQDDDAIIHHQRPIGLHANARGNATEVEMWSENNVERSASTQSSEQSPGLGVFWIHPVDEGRVVKLGFERERSVAILLRPLALRGGNTEKTRVVVEKMSKNRRTVGPWSAPPTNGAAGVDECKSALIGEQRVVLDGNHRCLVQENGD